MKNLLLLFISVLFSLSTFSQITIANGEIDSEENFYPTTTNELEGNSKWVILNPTDEIRCYMTSDLGDTNTVLVWYIESMYIQDKSKIYKVKNKIGDSFILVFSRIDHAVKLLNEQNDSWSIMSGKGLNYSQIN